MQSSDQNVYLVIFGHLEDFNTPTPFENFFISLLRVLLDDRKSNYC